MGYKPHLLNQEVWGVGGGMHSTSSVLQHDHALQVLGGEQVVWSPQKRPFHIAETH